MSALLKQYFEWDYPVVDKGEGIWLWDIQGKKYLDGTSGAMTANIGHGVEEVAQALYDQASKIAFAFRNQFTNAPAEKLAERLVKLAGGKISHAFFVNSGSEANEYVMRLVLQYWQEKGKPNKTQFISREQSYHGMTLGALSLSGFPARKVSFESMLHDFPKAASIHSYQGSRAQSASGTKGHAYDSYQHAIRQHEVNSIGNVKDWEQKILQIGASNVAAVVVEPITGAAGGALIAPKNYYRQLKEICDKHDVLLIFDEVITGLGRSGSWFACHYEGVEPDLITTAKGLTAGYSPVGAVLIGQEIIDTLKKGSGASPGGHTFSCNPLGAAACLAALDFIEKNQLIENVKKRAPELQVGLEQLAQKYPIMADIRGRGLLWGFDIVPVEKIALNHEEALSALSFARICQENGLLVYPSGMQPFNQAAMLAPPFVISAEEIQVLLQLLENSLEQLTQKASALMY